MKSLAQFAAAVLGAAVLYVAPVQAAPFLGNDLVVVQAGDGSASLSGNATAVFLKEFTTSGALVSTLNMPTAASGSNNPLTLSGSATSEGFLQVSADGNYLTMAGYGVAPGSVTPQTATPASAPRVVGVVDMNGNINTSTNLGTAYSGSNIRSAASSDGTNIWTGGNAGSGLGATGAVRYATLGGSSSTQINSSTTNIRVVDVFNGQLYASASSGAVLGVATVGTGEPTGSASISLLPGMPTTGTHSSYDFWFKDANTLYVADDGSAANGGGIQKWIFGGSTWSLSYTLACGTGLSGSSVGARGLTGEVDELGNVELFATSSDASPNRLVKITDLGAGSAFTTLATSPVGVGSTAFRGVALVPEPGSLALLAIGGLTLLRRRRA